MNRIPVFLVAASLAACTATNNSRDSSRLAPDVASRSHQRHGHSVPVHKKAIAAILAKAENHKKRIGRVWGLREIKMPSSHLFVKYSQNYNSRAVIDFETGSITVETVDRTRRKTSLKDTLITTILTPDDPRAIELYTAKPNRQAGKPYLFGLIHDHNDRHVHDKRSAVRYAAYLVNNKIQQREIKVHGKRTKVYFVNIQMVDDHQNLRARRYSKYVNKYAGKFRLRRRLIYAIIQTESNFNPYAVSSAPAFGLMQIVPRSGGRDAFKKVFNIDRIPSRAFLFNPENNIQLGAAYLNVLYYQYFAKIHNPSAREYCVIAAYNTGLGNVYSIFAKNRGAAIDTINKLTSSQVYRFLVKKLRYREARDYVFKVVKARPRYKDF